MSSPISSLLWPIEELELVDIGEKETLGLINIEEKESVVAKTLRVMKMENLLYYRKYSRKGLI